MFTPKYLDMGTRLCILEQDIKLVKIVCQKYMYMAKSDLHINIDPKKYMWPAIPKGAKSRDWSM